MKRIKESSRKNGRRALVVPSVVLLLIAGYLQIPASVWQMFEPRVAAVTFSSTTTNEGDINTIAGNGVQGFSGDGGAPLDAALFDPQIAFRVWKGNRAPARMITIPRGRTT